jgi:hypothetical protein
MPSSWCTGLRGIRRRDPPQSPHWIGCTQHDQVTTKRMLYWYTSIGALDHAYEFARSSLDEFDRRGLSLTPLRMLWMPEMRPFRRDPRLGDRNAFGIHGLLEEVWAAR